MSKEILLNQLTLFPGDSPVNPSQSQANEEEQTMTAISGMKLLESCPFTNPDGLLAKMWKELLTSKTAWSSDRCKMTWKKKVSKSNVVLFQLQASVLGIKERESGLLHTPTATANQGAPSMYKRDQGSWGNHMYPTPTTQDSRIGPNNIKGSQHRKERGNPALADKVLFPTPTPACEEGGQQSHRVERTKSGGFILRKKNKTNQSSGLWTPLRAFFSTFFRAREFARNRFDREETRSVLTEADEPPAGVEEEEEQAEPRREPWEC